MRFKEFLLQEDGETMSLAHGLEYIKERCIPFLQTIRGSDEWMYRGMKHAINKVQVLDQIKGRYPRDSAPGFNVMFNRGIELALGVRHVRASSLFCSGHLDSTEEYGAPFFVFPQGQFKYIWSPEISDSYIKEDFLYARFAKILGDLTDTDAAAVYQVKDIFKQIYQQSNADIERAVFNLKSNDELIEQIFQDNGVQAMCEEIDRALDKTFDQLYHPNDGLTTALGRGVEILIHDSDGCFFVPRGLVQSEISANKELEGQSPEEYLTNYFFPGA